MGREAASLASVWSHVLWCASCCDELRPLRGEQLKCVAQCASPLSGRGLIFLALDAADESGSLAVRPMLGKIGPLSGALRTCV